MCFGSGYISGKGADISGADTLRLTSSILYLLYSSLEVWLKIGKDMWTSLAVYIVQQYISCHKLVAKNTICPVHDEAKCLDTKC